MAAAPALRHEDQLAAGVPGGKQRQRRRGLVERELCSPAALTGAVHAIGIDNVMFAIDYPYEETGPAVKFLHELALAPADKEKIAHRNAERLLGLTPA